MTTDNDTEPSLLSNTLTSRSVGMLPPFVVAVENGRTTTAMAMSLHHTYEESKQEGDEER
eukprot:scaffold1374_cov175-Amphora_coffeaeformis.AAC.8